MNVVKGIVILSLFLILFGSCFNPPEFPVTPSISFAGKPVFKDVADPSIPDSLIITLKFKDGDGDLGLSATENDSPYHEVNYFLGNDAGQLTPLTTGRRYSNLPAFVNVGNKTGKLIRYRSRSNSAYNLPPYIKPFNCTAYVFDSVYVSEENKAIFDNTYKIVDTLKATNLPSVYVLLDTFYYQTNPNHYNIDVDFMVKVDPNNPDPEKRYEEYDFRNEFCTTFDGRFPVLATTASALDG